MSELLNNLQQEIVSLSLSDIIFPALAVFVAAILRGLTGFGFALAVVPLLSLTMSPTRAVPLAIVVQFLGSLLDLRSASRQCHWRSLRWLGLGAAIGSPAGAMMLRHVSGAVSGLAISAITLAAVAVLARGFTMHRLPSNSVTAGVGTIAGIFNGLAAMPGPPVVAYYMASPVNTSATRASLMMFFLLTSIAALASAAMVDLLSLSTFILAAMMLPAMWIGTMLGTLGFQRTSTNFHRKASMVSLTAIGIISALNIILRQL